MNIDNGFDSFKRSVAFKPSDLLFALRVTLVCILPLLVGNILGQLQFGVIVCIASIQVSLADVGETDRQRAWSMSLATVLTAIGIFLATIIGSILWLAILILFFWIFGFSIIEVLEERGSAARLVIMTIFVVFLGQGANPGVGFERSLAFFLGGGWAIVFSLWFWPFHPLQAKSAPQTTPDRSRSLHITSSQENTTGCNSRFIHVIRLLLREHLTSESCVFRYPLRLAFLEVLSVAIYSLLHLSFGYWISLTIITILRPDVATTRQRMLHRLIGTIVGGVLAAGLVVVVHSSLLIYIIIVITVF